MRGVRESLATKDPTFWEYSKELIFDRDMLDEAKREFKTTGDKEEKTGAKYKIKNYERAINSIEFSINRKIGGESSMRSEEVLKKLERLGKELEDVRQDKEKFRKKIIEFDREIERWRLS